MKKKDSLSTRLILTFVILYLTIFTSYDGNSDFLFGPSEKTKNFGMNVKNY
jgi:hypothetical protein